MAKGENKATVRRGDAEKADVAAVPQITLTLGADQALAIKALVVAGAAVPAAAGLVRMMELYLDALGE